MSLLTRDPREVARALSDPTVPGAQCMYGPPKSRRHHYVFRVVSGGAEPRVVFACAHCEHRAGDSRIEYELTEAECRAMEQTSLEGHRRHCKSKRPEIRPANTERGRRAPARRVR